MVASRWKRRMVGGLSLFVPACVAMACSSFGGEAPETLDAADAGNDVPVSPGLDASPAGATYDFEQGTTCDGWQPVEGATATPVAGGHASQRACLLCAGSAASKMRLTRGVDGGGTYALTAFVRAPDTDAATSAFLNLQPSDVPDGGPPSAFNRSPLGKAWSGVQTVYPNAGAATSSVDVYVAVEGNVGECLLVDDISLTHD